MFKPYIEKLILSLSRHCQMEPDTVSCGTCYLSVTVVSLNTMGTAGKEHVLT